MRYWFYTFYVVAMGTLILILDAALGALYVRYMVLLTGTVFMLGMLVGEGMEQRWTQRRQAENTSSEEGPAEVAMVFHPAAPKAQGGYPVSRSMTVSEASE